jgi:hypothetical protein
MEEYRASLYNYLMARWAKMVEQEGLMIADIKAHGIMVKRRIGESPWIRSLPIMTPKNIEHDREAWQMAAEGLYEAVSERRGR